MCATTRELGLKNLPAPSQSSELDDFSLVLGGPLFQLLRRSHLKGNTLELLHRRVLASVLLTWAPLLILSAVRTGIGSGAQVSFFQDIELHARFLVSLPILIGAELLVHSRIRAVVQRFVEYRLVLPNDLGRFRQAIESAMKIRDSKLVELGIIVAVYTLGLWISSSRINPAAPWRLTPAGSWYVFVSIPVFQFVLLRWYVRLFIWFRFLWQVNRIDLNLLPTHPDRCGGLSFVGKSSYAYGPILFAQGSILAGIVASRVLYRGETLQSFKFQIGGFVLFFVVAILGPLLMFTPRMARARRKGLAEYGLLAQRYVERFEHKWLREAHPSEELLGTGDIQSLADLANGYQVVREMRVVPFALQDASRLALATAVPLAPLLLTIFSFEELLIRVVKVVF